MIRRGEGDAGKLPSSVYRKPTTHSDQNLNFNSALPRSKKKQWFKINVVNKITTLFFKTFFILFFSMKNKTSFFQTFFSKALRIGYISFNSSSFEKDC